VRQVIRFQNANNIESARKLCSRSCSQPKLLERVATIDAVAVQRCTLTVSNDRVNMDADLAVLILIANETKQGNSGGGCNTSRNSSTKGYVQRASG
jgi:hypothetical protein